MNRDSRVNSYQLVEVAIDIVFTVDSVDFPECVIVAYCPCHEPLRSVHRTKKSIFTLKARHLSGSAFCEDCVCLSRQWEDFPLGSGLVVADQSEEFSCCRYNYITVYSKYAAQSCTL